MLFIIPVLEGFTRHYLRLLGFALLSRGTATQSAVRQGQCTSRFDYLGTLLKWHQVAYGESMEERDSAPGQTSRIPNLRCHFAIPTINHQPTTLQTP